MKTNKAVVDVLVSKLKESGGSVDVKYAGVHPKYGEVFYLTGDLWDGFCFSMDELMESTMKIPVTVNFV